MSESYNLFGNNIMNLINIGKRIDLISMIAPESKTIEEDISAFFSNNSVVEFNFGSENAEFLNQNLRITILRVYSAIGVNRAFKYNRVPLDEEYDEELSKHGMDMREPEVNPMEINFYD